MKRSVSIRKSSDGCYIVRVKGKHGIICPNLAQAREFRRLVLAGQDAPSAFRQASGGVKSSKRSKANQAGGYARQSALSKEERTALASKAATARWAKRKEVANGL